MNFDSVEKLGIIIKWRAFKESFVSGFWFENQKIEFKLKPSNIQYWKYHVNYNFFITNLLTILLIITPIGDLMSDYLQGYDEKNINDEISLILLCNAGQSRT